MLVVCFLVLPFTSFVVQLCCTSSELSRHSHPIFLSYLPQLPAAFMFSGQCVWLGTALLSPPFRDVLPRTPSYVEMTAYMALAVRLHCVKIHVAGREGRMKKAFLSGRFVGAKVFRPPARPGLYRSGLGGLSLQFLPPFDTVLSAFSYPPNNHTHPLVLKRLLMCFGELFLR